MTKLLTRTRWPESAGLQVGDIIVAVNGDPSTASQPSDADLLATTIRQYKIGTDVELDVLRDRETAQGHRQARSIATIAPRDEEVRR